MKKILLSIILICSLVIGCGKSGEKEILKKLTNKIENSKSYQLSGELEMINNEDTYKYLVTVSYKEEEMYRVSLKNQINNHEQIILKNEEGVYVLTPSLNKSFKFQSEWPYNNSQSYLLQTLLNDIKNDKNKEFKKTVDGYVITTKVNYSNNKDLEKQNIFLNNDLNIKEVHVLDKENKVMIKMKFKDIDFKAVPNSKLFIVKDNMESAVIDEIVQPVSKIKDVLYPMYLPLNTKLIDQSRVEKENGERIISTFSGDKPFMFVQETVEKENDLVTIPVIGKPLIMAGTIAALSDSSISWSNGGLDYYLVSDVMNEEELFDVARSISAIPVGK